MKKIHTNYSPPQSQSIDNRLPVHTLPFCNRIGIKDFSPFFTGLRGAD